jgi:hypothetical protein
MRANVIVEQLIANVHREKSGHAKLKLPSPEPAEN